jgi:hypothetical protein
MALSYFKAKKLLFMGDELGNIKIWDLSDLLDKVQHNRNEE